MERVDAARRRSAPPYTETPAGLQEMAARARRLAHDRLDEQTIAKLTEFAEDLKARATCTGRPRTSLQPRGGRGGAES
jgi:hypothetical protein